MESLLQERNAAQPQVDQRPPRAADPSIPISTYVNNLRHEFENLPGPEVPDFDPFDFETTVHVPDFSPTDDLAALSSLDISQDGSAPDAPLPLPLSALQTSTGFQEDAVFLQSTAFEPEAIVETDSDLPPPIPPPIPTSGGCDWYLPPPELGTSLLAEFLTDFNAAWPLYQPHLIADHLRVCYAGQSDNSIVSWISAYVVFGIAHM